MTSSLVQVNYLLLKLNRKLIKMFLNLKRESNPQPSDDETLHWASSIQMTEWGLQSVQVRTIPIWGSETFSEFEKKLEFKRKLINTKP